MATYPTPFNEKARLKALDSLGLNGKASDPLLDEIVALVRSLLDVPAALVTIVERDRQWFKAVDGLALTETPRSHAICSHTIAGNRPLVISDTHEDRRFIHHPAVVEAPHVRFYAGVPLVLSSGFRIGGLCGVDFQPRAAPSPEVMRTLEALARVVVAGLERGGPPSVPVNPEAYASLETARQDFLSLISHELRTPLNGIVGLAGLLADRLADGPADGPERELVDGIIASGDQLSRVVSHILTYSDLVTGTLHLKEERVATETLLADVLSASLPPLRLSNTNLQLAGGSPPPHLMLDRAQFGLALTCVIGNAASHGGPTVTLSCQTGPQGQAVFIVRDNGRGLQADQIEKVMEPFTIGEEIKSRAGQGIGLGLPLTRRLVELHGGEIAFGREEGWTIVRLTLPAWRTVAAC